MAESVSTKIESKQSEYQGKKLRVAIIGCGGIAQTHMKAYKMVPEVEIVAGVDIKEDRLELMNKEWGIPKEALFTDWKEMLSVIKPDAVDVCTPNGVHCAPVVDACNAGCHAIVEKPMAMNPAECEKMIAAAKANDVKLSVGFQQRYRNNTQALIQARNEGRFGDIMFVKCQALRRRGIPNWGVFGQKAFDTFFDLWTFVFLFRSVSDDDVVIYTGYNKDEVQDEIKTLQESSNIIIKYGRYIPGQQPHYDEVLGVNLASDNQYAEKIC